MQLRLELVLHHCQLDVRSLQKWLPHIKAVVVVRNHHFDIGVTRKLAGSVFDRHANFFNAHLENGVEYSV